MSVINQTVFHPPVGARDVTATNRTLVDMIDLVVDIKCNRKASPEQFPS